MILHCKNAEMTIILSYLHFYKVVNHTIFVIFFLIFNFFFNLVFFYFGENKKSQKYFIFFSKMQKFGSEDP